MPTNVNDMESSYDELRISKRQIEQCSFGDDFYTYLIEHESSSYFEAISSPNVLLWKEAIKNELYSILKKSNLGVNRFTFRRKTYWLQVDFQKKIFTRCFN